MLSSPSLALRSCVRNVLGTRCQEVRCLIRDGVCAYSDDVNVIKLWPLAVHSPSPIVRRHFPARFRFTNGPLILVSSAPGPPTI